MSEELSESDVLLTSLYFKGAINESGAIHPEPWMRRKIVKKLVETEWLHRLEDGRVFLSPLGLMATMLIIRDTY